MLSWSLNLSYHLLICIDSEVQAQYQLLLALISLVFFNFVQGSSINSNFEPLIWMNIPVRRLIVVNYDYSILWSFLSTYRLFLAITRARVTWVWHTTTIITIQAWIGHYRTFFLQLWICILPFGLHDLIILPLILTISDCFGVQA